MIFSEHGIPQTLFSDNGPCYASQEFKNFSNEWEFNHTTSSPVYPQSNGFAERMVQTVKDRMNKCKDINLALLHLRNTPTSYLLPSPAQLLYNRSLNSTLPTINEKEHNTDAHKALKAAQMKQKEYYDRGAQQRAELSPGQPVMLQNDDMNWRTATVVQRTPEPRSYIVQDTEWHRYRRNRRFLRPIPQPRTTQGSENERPELPEPQHTAAPAQTATQPDATLESEITAPSLETEGTPSQPSTGPEQQPPKEVTFAPEPRRSNRDRRPPQRLIEQD
jgi:hypothetical protein